MILFIMASFVKTFFCTDGKRYASVKPQFFAILFLFNRTSNNLLVFFISHLSHKLEFIQHFNFTVFEVKNNILSFFQIKFSWQQVFYKCFWTEKMHKKQQRFVKIYLSFYSGFCIAYLLQKNFNIFFLRHFEAFCFTCQQIFVAMRDEHQKKLRLSKKKTKM